MRQRPAGYDCIAPESAREGLFWPVCHRWKVSVFHLLGLSLLILSHDVIYYSLLLGVLTLTAAIFNGFSWTSVYSTMILTRNQDPSKSTSPSGWSVFTWTANLSSCIIVDFRSIASSNESSQICIFQVFYWESHVLARCGHRWVVLSECCSRSLQCK